MRKILLFVLLGMFTLTSCDESVSERDKRLANENKDEIVEEKKSIDETVTSSNYEPTITYIGEETYWYVRFDEIKEDGSITDWHRAIKINKSYFDFVEFKKVMDSELTGDVYVNFFTQINKETYDSYHVFKETCYKINK